MFLRVRSHVTLANVVSLIALFVALGGTALGAVIITSNSQVEKNTISGHRPPAGKHPNIIGGSINGPDVRDISFQALTLKNGWKGNCFGGGVPRIARSVEGIFYLRGELCRTSGSSNNPFAVPPGFEPIKTEWIAVDQADAATGRIVVYPSGEVFVDDDPDHAGAGASFTSLAGASYTLP